MHMFLTLTFWYSFDILRILVHKPPIKNQFFSISWFWAPFGRKKLISIKSYNFFKCNCPYLPLHNLCKFYINRLSLLYSVLYMCTVFVMKRGMDPPSWFWYFSQLMAGCYITAVSMAGTLLPVLVPPPFFLTTHSHLTHHSFSPTPLYSFSPNTLIILT